MNTLHLKYIVKVAETGSVTLAAENLYMSQPNLSKAIKELENTIGIEIFKRTPKGLVPTKKGEEFLSYARKILVQVEEMENLYKTKDENKISFSLSVPRASYISHAFTLFADNLDKSKNLKINYKETNSMRTIKNVVDGEYHLGIIRFQKNYESYFMKFIKDKGLKYETIWDFECLALMSEKNSFARLENISYKELNKCIEIVHGDITVPYISANELIKNEDIDNKKRLVYIYERGSQFDFLIQITESYMWVSPMPQQHLVRYGLVQKKCPDANQLYKDVIIYQKNLSDIDKAFIDEINRTKDSISKF